MENKSPFSFRKLKIVLISVLFLSPVMVWGVWVIEQQKIDVHTHQIVKRFMCICSMDCGLKLSECSCPQKGGALEKKAYIGRMVKEGFSDAEIVDSFRKKYGGLIE